MNTVELFKLIRRFEGCRLKAYLCPAGKWTCGWGSTGADVGPNTVWTQEQADARMEQDAQWFVKEVLKLCPRLANHPNQLCAVADFAYNLGIGRLKASTLLKKVIQDDTPAVRIEFMKWVYGGGKVLRGLFIRRSAECALYASD